MIGSLCVYCGSRVGNDPRNVEIATELGRLMAAAGVRLVYGGGSVGLMGAVADSVMVNGGAVTGVIPKGLFRTEIGHRGITELIEVASMHERKARMASEADAFLALPGGLGTLEELAEIATWAQLGIHSKPVGVLDVDGFWAPLLEFLDGTVAAGFVSVENRALVAHITDVADVLPMLSSRLVPGVEPVLGIDES